MSKTTLAQTALKNLEFEIRSRRPLVYICSHEEKRVMDDITNICREQKTPWNLYTWDAANRLKNQLKPQDKIADIPDKPLALLEWFDKLDTDANTTNILVVKDYHKFLGANGAVSLSENQTIRCLRNLAQKFMSVRKTIIFLSTELYLPSELMKITKVIDWPLPEPEHIKAKVQQALKTVSNRAADFPNFDLNYDNDEMDSIVRSFQGLILEEVELTLSRMVLEHNRFTPNAIIAHKEEIIRKGGILEWLPSETSVDMVGGLEGIKEWLYLRRNAFSQEARDYGLPLPKGVLLVGISGTGKTLIAKAIANHWKVPLIRLDMGKIFSGLVGSSEANLRQAIRIAESTAPVVLLVDELDKAFSSNSRSDSGTTARVMGEFLYWAQEKTSPVFLVATANDITVLPPELLRKGRFDEIFFVNLPGKLERKEIFKIHLQKLDRKHEDFDLDVLAEKSKYYTGAEIEACIISALYDSFSDNKRELKNKDILSSIQTTTPLAYTMREQIVNLQTWAKNRARMSSSVSENLQNNKQIKEQSWIEDMNTCVSNDNE